MPITKVNGTVTYTTPEDSGRAQATGVYNADGFAICDANDPLKQIKFDASGVTTNKSVTINAGSATSDITLTLPSSSATISPFKTIQHSAPSGAGNVVIASTTEVLVITPTAANFLVTTKFPLQPVHGQVFTIHVGATAQSVAIETDDLSNSSYSPDDPPLIKTKGDFATYVYSLTTDTYYLISVKVA